MIRPPDRLPGVAVIIDVAPPCQCLKSYPHTPFGGQFAKFTQIGSGAFDASEAIRRDIGTDHQQVAAKLLHNIELALRTLEHPRPTVSWHTFKIAKRLKRYGPKTKPLNHLPNFGRRTVERQ